MDRRQLRSYARSARQDFLRAVESRLHCLGFTPQFFQQGDLESISDDKRKAAIKLSLEIENYGYHSVLERYAYLFFNCLIGLRFLELNNCLQFKVLGPGSSGGMPEILENALLADFDGCFDRSYVFELSQQTNADEKLYRYLLLAQCRQLRDKIPALFGAVDQDTEILFPDALLASDSVVSKLLLGIAEDEFTKGVEIIGWLYQYYMEELREFLIGTVPNAQGISVVTQLFTPEWIARYLLENTIVPLWFNDNPDSKIAEGADFYIQQRSGRADFAHFSSPEKIKVIDPACGSGHLLLQAYDLLRKIYFERGYQRTEIAYLILQRNLYGLDIDERATQMATFALLMKAREDCPEILSRPPDINLFTLRSSEGCNAEESADLFLRYQKQKSSVEHFSAAHTLFDLLPDQDTAEWSKADLLEFIDLFRLANLAGSLITIPEKLQAKLVNFGLVIEYIMATASSSEAAEAELLKQLFNQAVLLSVRFDVVVANPPYMGQRYFPVKLKNFLREHYRDFDRDLFSAFIVRLLIFARQDAYIGIMCPFVWMFISSYQRLRQKLINESAIRSLIQLEYSGFEGATVPVCAFCLQAGSADDVSGTYISLSDFKGAAQQGDRALQAIQIPDCSWSYQVSQKDFLKIPGMPLAYWISPQLRRLFAGEKPLAQAAKTAVGLNTGDNRRFLRMWFEVERSSIGFGMQNLSQAAASSFKWFPYNKGGQFRKWYGNYLYVINWQHDGKEVKEYALIRNKGKHWSRYIQNLQYMFQEGITWTFLSSSRFGVRYLPAGFLFDVAGSSLFTRADNIYKCCAFLCSGFAFQALRAINPTLNFQAGNLNRLPYAEDKLEKHAGQLEVLAKEAISLAKQDWDQSELSWDFSAADLLLQAEGCHDLETFLQQQQRICRQRADRLAELETSNDWLIADAYDVLDQLDQLKGQPSSLMAGDTLTLLKNFISFAVGCIFGRYSIASLGCTGDRSKNAHSEFAVEDGLLVLTDDPFFGINISERFGRFLQLLWGSGSRQQNMSFVNSKLLPQQPKNPDSPLSHYFQRQFSGEHQKRFRGRPLYWHFSSGRKKAFQCLLYIHSYQPSTLSVLRSKYLLPFMQELQRREMAWQTKMSSAASGDKAVCRDELKKNTDLIVELQQYDRQLHHLALQNISLDPDDGVLANREKLRALLLMST